ncbi:MAG: hypothetical protein ACTS22_08490 [Phycisphaerales bacterium]
MLTRCIGFAAAVLASPFVSAAQPEVPPLAGPSVDPGRTQTLINESMRSGFQRLETRPEIAVVDLLDVDETTRLAVRELGQQRIVDLAAFLVDHIDELRAITDDLTAGRQDAARAKTRALWTTFDPSHSVTPMLNAVHDMLPDEQTDRAAALVGEYLDAWTEAEQRNDETAEQTRERLAFQLFQEELRSAYDISLQNTRQALDAIYSAVEPTPEQRERIRSIVIEHIKRTRLEATPAERRAVMRTIYDSLDEERRGRLFDYAMRVVLPEG